MQFQKIWNIRKSSKKLFHTSFFKIELASQLSVYESVLVYFYRPFFCLFVFKVLFGKVKKIQPSVDKNKVSLDPCPNFDCHMSKNIPSLKDTIELQAYNSAVCQCFSSFDYLKVTCFTLYDTRLKISSQKTKGKPLNSFNIT